VSAEARTSVVQNRSGLTNDAAATVDIALVNMGFDDHQYCSTMQ
jgi:hypothetical protein